MVEDFDDAKQSSSVGCCTGGRVEIDADVPTNVEVNAGVTAILKLGWVVEIDAKANYKMADSISAVLGHTARVSLDLFQELPAVKAGIDQMGFPPA